MRALVLGVVIVTACGGGGADVASQAAAPTAAPSSAPTRLARPTAAVALGADPEAGTIEFVDGPAVGPGGWWRYDGATGQLAAFVPPSQPPVSAVRHLERLISVSPSGRLRAFALPVRLPDQVITELWLETANGARRPLYRPAPRGPSLKGELHPMARETGPSFYWANWSPDERYAAIFDASLVSASADADGRPLIVIDVGTGARTDLGYTLLRHPVWRAPHTLAFVAGAGRDTWQAKRLRLWSPEHGIRDLTQPDEVGLAPVWAPDGTVLFVRAPDGPHDPLKFAAGVGIGDRRIVRVDPQTGARTVLPSAAGHADVGVRVSADGRRLLLLRKRLDRIATSTYELTDRLEIWSARADGSGARPLLALAGLGFGYYGTYTVLDRAAWSLDPRR